MVILLAGASHVGKTLMAQKLLEIYKIPYLSIDHLKMGLYRSGFDYGFTPESKDKIITEKLWPIIKGIITEGYVFQDTQVVSREHTPYRHDQRWPYFRRQVRTAALART